MCKMTTLVLSVALALTVGPVAGQVAFGDGGGPLEDVELFTKTQACQTVPTKDGTKTSTRCEIPFIFKGKKYKSCTRTGDPQNKPWCSVGVNATGHHIPGKKLWGHCDPRTCISGQGGGSGGMSLKKKCYTVPSRTGKTPNKPCMFPFRYNGRIYTKCTTDDDEDGRAWCSTRVRSDGSHVKDNWGHCNCTGSGGGGGGGGGGDGTCSPPDPRNSLNSRFSSRGDFLPAFDSGLCGIPSSEPTGFIIGGQDADVHERDNDRFSYICGGSLINKRYVLTAAHCVDRHLANPRELHVTVGELDTSKTCDCRGEDLCANTPQTFRVTDIELPDDWHGFGSNENHNDIALLRLDGTVILSRSVSPICLPLDPRGVAAAAEVADLQGGLTGALVTVFGWGRVRFNSPGDHEKGGSTATPILKYVSMPMTSERECENSISATFRRKIDSKIQLCAGLAGQDSCKGDSGGPLVITTRSLSQPAYVQLGLVSYGSDECGNGVPGIYTRLTGYTGWIRSKLRP